MYVSTLYPWICRAVYITQQFSNSRYYSLRRACLSLLMEEKLHCLALFFSF